MSHDISSDSSRTICKNKAFLVVILLANAFLLATPQFVLGESWGTLRGKFVYDGDPPEAPKANVNKDMDICGKSPLVVEDLLVDSSGGVANVGVWLVSKDVAEHPEYAETADSVVTLDNKNCRFEPHLGVVRVGQTLRLHNSDPVSHNVNGGSFRKNTPFNDNLPPESSVEKKFKGEERLGVPLSCGSHGWMKSYLLVKKTPYVAVSQSDGTFEIRNLPAGKKLEFKTWHAPSGYITEPSMGGEKTKWKRGQFEIMIEEGDNDLGEIKVSPKDLQ
jgi:plastocyanin